jgi:acyl carrier protein
MSDELRAKIRAFVTTRFPAVRDKGLKDSDSLLDSGAVDSLGILDLASFITTELGVELGDDDLNPENFDNIDALTAFLAKKKG